MGYSDLIYIKTVNELAAKREAARQETTARKMEVLQKVPELNSLYGEIASYGVDLVEAMGKGDNGKEFIDALRQKSLAAQKKRDEMIIAAGYPANYIGDGYFCSKCKDSGIDNGHACTCYTKTAKKIALDELAKAAPLAKSRFDNFDVSFYPDSPDGKTGIVPRKRMKEIYNFCQSYAEDFSITSPSLFMYGETGLGKTHLSLAIAGRVTEDGSGVVYGSAQNILSALEKEHFNRSSPDAKYNIDSLLSCDLLIIDDLGAEFSTSFTVSCIYNIINTRISNSLPVIINTNLTPAELEEKYSRRITSRIIGNYVSLMFFGRDIRQLKMYN